MSKTLTSSPKLDGYRMPAQWESYWVPKRKAPKSFRVADVSQ